MKLLLCLECQDVQKIIGAERSCFCGACSASLADDGLHAKVSGPCQVLGIGSSSLAQAVSKQVEIGDKGLRKMDSPVLKQMKLLQKTNPLLAWHLAGSLSPSQLKRPLKGRRFLAFVIPYAADTVERLKVP